MAGTYAVIDITAKYRIDSSVADPAGYSGFFHLEVDGIDVAGPLSVASTGGVDTYATVKEQGIQLAEGIRIFRLVFDSSQ